MFSVARRQDTFWVHRRFSVWAVRAFEEQKSITNKKLSWCWRTRATRFEVSDDLSQSLGQAPVP